MATSTIPETKVREGANGAPKSTQKAGTKYVYSFGGGKADEQSALLAVGSRGVAQRTLQKRTEHIADAGGGGTDTDRRETGTDNLGGSEIHD